MLVDMAEAEGMVLRKQKQPATGSGRCGVVRPSLGVVQLTSCVRLCLGSAEWETNPEGKWMQARSGGACGHRDAGVGC